MKKNNLMSGMKKEMRAAMDNAVAEMVKGMLPTITKTVAKQVAPIYAQNLCEELVSDMVKPVTKTRSAKRSEWNPAEWNPDDKTVTVMIRSEKVYELRTSSICEDNLKERYTLTVSGNVGKIAKTLAMDAVLGSLDLSKVVLVDYYKPTRNGKNTYPVKGLYKMNKTVVDSLIKAGFNPVGGNDTLCKTVIISADSLKTYAVKRYSK